MVFKQQQKLKKVHILFNAQIINTQTNAIVMSYKRGFQSCA